MENLYRIQEEEQLLTPCLVYYEDLIRKNTKRIIELAGGDPERLWPHIKTHKSLDMTKLLMSYGIHKFKTATIAEAEMCAMAGASDIVLAYPLVGPNRERLVRLSLAYPKIRFYAIQDDMDQIRQLSAFLGDKAKEGLIPADYVVPLLIDVDLGLRRTGASIEDLEKMVSKTSELPFLQMDGFHCYDGHRHETDYQERDQRVKETDQRIQEVIENLRKGGYPLPVIIAGGTPSFPCHAAHTDWYLSPGTSFIHDWGYDVHFPDLQCTPAAVVASRVVSHPAPHTFTCDCGVKAIATDPAPERGTIAGLPEAKTVMQNEEHWVFRLPENMEVPSIGTVLYIIPTHICPTSALYPEILVAEQGQITKTWPVTARNRKLCY
ncbi:MAG: D-TA family PLP-dependent enzyme [Firmicutes bacterium]|nr:D-TA family PLP-dependent enzyme [Bacillota bacterium]